MRLLHVGGEEDSPLFETEKTRGGLGFYGQVYINVEFFPRLGVVLFDFWGGFCCFFIWSL